MHVTILKIYIFVHKLVLNHRIPKTPRLMYCTDCFATKSLKYHAFRAMISVKLLEQVYITIIP